MAGSWLSEALDASSEQHKPVEKPVMPTVHMPVTSDRTSELERTNAPAVSFTATTVSIPEQIAGSAHEFHGFDMVSQDHRTATVVAVLEDAAGKAGNPRVREALSIVYPSSGPMILTKSPLSVNLRFAPPTGVFGSWNGHVRIHLFWSDGSKHERAIRVRVASRTLDQLPEQPSVAAQNFDTEKPDVRTDLSEDVGKEGKNISDDYADTDDLKPRYFQALGGELAKLGAAAKTLVGLQQGGLTLAWSRANKFERAAPKPGAMSLLATAAIAAATEGTGAWVGETLGPEIAGMFTDKVGKELEEMMISKVAAEAIKSVAISGIDYGTEGMREGGGEEGKSGDENGSGEVSQSSDVVGTFFFMQGQMLTQRTAAVEKAVVNEGPRLLPHMRTDPEAVLNRIRAATTVLEKHGTATKPGVLQEKASALAWMRCVAEAVSNKETAFTAAHNNDRGKSILANKPEDWNADGTLMIEADVTYGKVSRSFVSSARINGFSPYTAERLQDVPLNQTGLPITIGIRGDHGERTTLSVDTGGRVRIRGLLARDYADPDAQQHPDSTEVQAMGSAEAVVKHLLSRSLASWGVGITTDQKPNNNAMSKGKG